MWVHTLPWQYRLRTQNVLEEYHCQDYKFLARVLCHDAIIKNMINLFGRAQVEDECKMQKKIYWGHDNPIMKLDDDQNIFLVTSLIYSLKN